MAEIIRFGPFRLHPVQRSLRRESEEVPLGGRAFDILLMLLENAGTIVSQREIIDRVWHGVFVEEAGLRVQIATLRKALGDGQDGARYIQTVPRRGYSFVGAIETSGPQPDAPQANARPVVAPLPPSLANSLPPRLARMVGREGTIAELVEKLKEDRFVTLVGAAGIGKTTVAISLAHEMSTFFDGAVAFVDLGALTSENLLEAAVAAAVGLAPQNENVLPGLLAFLRERTLLIVLDNCEHVIDAASRVAERIYQEAPGVFVLATSREALRVEGERVYLLAALENPPPDQPVTADDLLAWPAAQLFVERAAAGGYRFELSDDDAAIVTSICHRLDGIALAIELAAVRVATHGIAGTAELLNHRFNILWRGRRNALPRQQTMLATINWSYDLLSDEERRVLARLSIFVGAFTLEAAQRIVSDSVITPMQVAAAVVGLADKCLVQIAADGRYRLLEITRSYAAVKLEESGERNAIACRHAAFCSEVLTGGGNTSVFPDTTALLGNLHSALEWSFSDPDRREIALPLAALAVPVFRFHARLSECLRWCERALAILDHPFRGTKTEFALLEGLAVSLMFTQGNREDVGQIIQRCLEAARSLGNKEDEFRQLTWLHIFYTRISDLEKTIEVAKSGEKIARQLGHDGALAAGEWMLGASFHFAGEHREAQRHCEAALGYADGSKAAAYLGIGQQVRGLTVYARTLWLRGFPDRAEDVVQRAIEEAEMHQNPLALCLALTYGATLSIWRKELAVADHRVRRLNACAATNSLKPFEAAGTGLRGEVAVSRGEIHAGIDDLRVALSRLEEERYLFFSTGFLRVLGEAMAANGQVEEGTAMLDRARAQARARGEIYLLPDLLRARGVIQSRAAAPDFHAMESDLRASVELARAQGAPAWEVRAALPLAQHWLSSGRELEARQLLQGALGALPEGIEDPEALSAMALVADLA